MSSHSGPHSNKKNLVFGLDTGYGVSEKGKQTKHYKGQPVTNGQNSDRAAMNPTGTASWGCYDGNNTPYHSWNVAQYKQDVVIPGPFGGKTTAMYYNNPSGGFFGPTDWSGIPNSMLQAGNTITLQAWVKAASPQSIGKTIAPQIYYSKSGGGAHASETVYTLTGDWQLVYHTHTVSTAASNTGNFYLFTDQSSGGCDVYITMTGMYDKSHPVHWTTGTRSSTGGLLDMSPTGASIDLTNVSIDSTGLPTFDGSNDYFTSTLTGVDLDSGCTIEGILRRNSTPSAWRTFFNIKPNGSNTPFFEFRSTGAVTNIALNYYAAPDYITTAETLTNGQYYHCVGTYDGSGTLVMYINGEQKQTRTGVPAFALGTSPRITVGRAYDTSRYTDITAPVVKVYNVPLTARQIKENYLSYKTRFNL